MSIYWFSLSFPAPGPAAMRFEAGHPVINASVNGMPSAYSPVNWGCIGPQLVSTEAPGRCS